MPSQFAPVVPAGALSERPQPRINGHGLLLRPWRELDIPALIAAYADPEISYWHARTFSDAHEARDWLRRRERLRMRETAVDWAVVDPADDTIVLGRAGLNSVDLAEGIAEEDSLAENVQRAPLHPLDQFRAFLAQGEDPAANFTTLSPRA